MVKVRGKDRAKARLRRITGPEAKAKIAETLFAMGQTIQVAAQVSITNGAVSGKGHVPSLPGEPPNQDTGVLANNIETIQQSPTKVLVASNAPYASHLEYGTSKMQPRPYMAPAVAQTADDRARLLQGLKSYLARMK